MMLSRTFFLCIPSWITAVVANIAGTELNSLRILSYNVRYDSMPDSITVNESINSLPGGIPQVPAAYYESTSEQPWSLRRIHVANQILLSQADIYGGQELLQRQVLDLEELLGDRFAWVGIGRDDGHTAGEYSAIFYKKHKLDLQDWDTFWLTATPFDVSKYPGAGSYRTATVAHFLYHGGLITVINTHLDEQSAEQRRLGASLILHRAKYEAIETKRPIFVTGDFNSPGSDGAYQIITGVMKPEPLNRTFTDRYNWTLAEEEGSLTFSLQDLLGETPPHRRSGHYATFTDFAAPDDYKEFNRIDYVFGGSNGGWRAEQYHVNENLRDDGVYTSDHRPVEAHLKLYNNVDLTLQ